jgi:hypothetical protein
MTENVLLDHYDLGMLTEGRRQQVLQLKEEEERA